MPDYSNNDTPTCQAHDMMLEQSTTMNSTRVKELAPHHATHVHCDKAFQYNHSIGGQEHTMYFHSKNSKTFLLHEHSPPYIGYLGRFATITELLL